MFFLILFVLLPIIEITLLIKIGASIGAFATILLLILSAVLGIQLLRIQGFFALLKLNENMQRGEVPTEHILATMLLAAVGLLLIIPGFFTSIIGFIGLLPVVRHLIAKRWIAKQVGTMHSTIIEAEFYRTEPQRPIIEINPENKD